MNGDRLLVPTFEIASCPTIKLSDIRARQTWCSTRLVDRLDAWGRMMRRAETSFASTGSPGLRFLDIAENRT